MAGPDSGSLEMAASSVCNISRNDLQQAAKANSLDDFKLVFDQALDGLFIDRMDGNDEIFRRVMSDEQFRAVAAGYLLQRVYGQARK